MKIINSESLIREPYGTVYIGFSPRMYDGELKIKEKQRYNLLNSWFFTSVLPWQTNEDKWDKLVDNNYIGEIETEEFCTDEEINKEYDNNALWIVFTKEEVKEIISRLINTL